MTPEEFNQAERSYREMMKPKDYPDPFFKEPEPQPEPPADPKPRLPRTLHDLRQAMEDAEDSPTGTIDPPRDPQPGDVGVNVELCGGKYTVQQDPTGRLMALRYGQPWRDLCGDNLILALAQEIESLRARLAAIPPLLSYDPATGVIVVVPDKPAPADKPETCRWRYEQSQEWYSFSCGKGLPLDETNALTIFPFCPGCGRRVVIEETTKQ